MNLKRLFLTSCFAAVVFSASVALADGRARATRSQPAITRSAPRFTPIARSSSTTFHQSRANWNRGSANWSRSSNWRHWDGDWRHRHFRDRIVFIGGFGYPFGYPGYYPYSYYGYYPYYPYGYYPYDYSSYNAGIYQGGATYGDDAVYQDDPTYSNSRAYRGSRASSATVAQVQRTLAREGYYKGPIDGEMGSRTYYAIRAYQRSHNLRVDGTINNQLLATMGRR